MKKMMTLIFAAFLFSCTTQTGVQWFEGSFADAVQAAKNSNKPVLVDFYSDT